MREKLNLYTHDGKFHADEVFATAMLSLIAKEINVVRGPDTEIPEGDDWIVYDIGGGELDHHTQENRGNNGTHPGTQIPYAACGLVWQKFHEEILEALNCPETFYEEAFRRVDRSLVQGIDVCDNEFNPVEAQLMEIPNLTPDQRREVLKSAHHSLTITDIVKDFNPPWNSDLDVYESFMDAVSFAKDILLNRIDSVLSSLEARDTVQRAIDYSANHLLILDEFVPWEGVLYSQKTNPKANDIWYTIYPAMRGGWNMQCARIDSEHRTVYRHPLPEEWYGLRGEEFQNMTGVKDAQFCHVTGFLCGADSQEGILELARQALG